MPPAGLRYEGPRIPTLHDGGRGDRLIERFAHVSRAPVRTGARSRRGGAPGEGYQVTRAAARSAAGPWSSRAGPATSRRCRRFADAVPPSVEQLTPFDYRDPAKLPDGGVLVVGASATGVQLAAELQRSGPGRSPCRWGSTCGCRAPTVAATCCGGWTRRGCGASGTTRSKISRGPGGCPRPSSSGLPSGRRSTSTRSPRWASSWWAAGSGAGRPRAVLRRPAQRVLARGPQDGALLDTFDEWARAHGRDAESALPSASRRPRAASPRLQLDLRSGEIRSVVWATGFRPDYGWLDVPVVDAKGQLRHEGGVVDSPGCTRWGCPCCGGASPRSSTASRTTHVEVIDHLARYLAAGR
jgi:putative flavoprotein involved in K+ transport